MADTSTISDDPATAVPSSSSRPLPPPAKHTQKFRGVYKCGKRFKAQLQAGGVQYYLGTFNTEEDAARAYDKKAREEKGLRSLTNFDEDGGRRLSTADASDDDVGSGDKATARTTTTATATAVAAATAVAEAALAEATGKRATPRLRLGKESASSSSSSSSSSSKRAKVDAVGAAAAVGHEIELMSGAHAESGGGMASHAREDAAGSAEVRAMWERFCVVSQRLMLAKAAEIKLKDVVAGCHVLSALQDEIALLAAAKVELEAAIAEYVAHGHVLG